MDGCREDDGGGGPPLDTRGGTCPRTVTYRERMRRTVATDPTGKRAVVSGSTARRGLAALCLVLACVVPAVALATWWAYGQATDTARFTATARPLASDATVQRAVVDELVRTASARLGELPGGQDAARARIRTIADAVVATQAYRRSWRALQRSAHARLATRLTGDVTAPLTLDLAPIAALVRTRLERAGLAPVAEAIADPAPVTLLDRAEVRRAHDATDTVRIVRGIAIPLAVLALIGVLLTAPRLAGGLVRAGLCLGVSTLLTVGADELAASEIKGALRRAIYDALTDPLHGWVVGGIVAAVAFVLAGAAVTALSGPRRAPRRPAGALPGA